MSEHTPGRLTHEESLAVNARTSTYGLRSEELRGVYDFVLATDYAAILAINADLLAALVAGRATHNEPCSGDCEFIREADAAIAKAKGEA